MWPFEGKTYTFYPLNLKFIQTQEISAGDCLDCISTKINASLTPVTDLAGKARL